MIHSVLAIPLGKARAPWQIGLTLDPPITRAIPAKVPRQLCILSLLALIWLAIPGAAQAAPILEIRDRVDVEMDPVRRQDGLAFVRGRVVQRATGEGAAYMQVRVRVDDDETTVLSDGAGYFSASFQISDGKHLMSVDAEGSPNLDAAHFEMADFDINKRPLALSLVAATELADTAETLTLMVYARSDTDGASVAVDVFYGAAGETMLKVGTTTTDAKGEATFTLGRDQLGAPGRKRIELRFPGNDNYDAATAGANVNITGSSTLSLLADHSRYDYGDTLRASGRLQDGRGDAITSAIVGIEVNGQRIGNARTDLRGDYRIKIDTEELGSGSTAMQAVYRPSESWNRTSQSEPVTVEIGDRKPIPLSSTLAAFALTSFALLSFVGLRTRPWERWLRRSAASDHDRGETTEAGDVVPPTGLLVSKPKLSSTLRRAHHFDIDGQVLDAVTQKPIPGACITIMDPTKGERSLECASDGRFAIEDLGEGQHQVEVRARLYVRESFAIGIPHRGELRATRIHLMPVREKIFALYTDAVRHRLPDSRLWGIWTPRQILEHIRSGASSDALSDLTDFVEESFFSARRPGEEMLEHARTKIAAMRAEGAPGQDGTRVPI